MRKDIRELVKRAVGQGWRVEERRGGSILLYSPDGETIVTLHQTPSSQSWRHKAIRDLRRGGFES